MGNHATLEVAALDPLERGGMISSILSDAFSAKWEVEPRGGEYLPARITIANADGVSFTRSHMTPMRLHNARPSGERKYYVYTADRATELRVSEDTSHLLGAGDLLIMRSDLSSSWLVDRPYETSSLIFDPGLFEQMVPTHEAVVGRRIRCAPSLQMLMGQMMDVAWDLTERDMFEQSGSQLGRSFLEMLSAAISADNWSAPGRQDSVTALESRRLKIQSYISQHFSDAELSVASLAKAMQISPRYVQIAFAQEDLTPSRYIWMVRIKAAAAMLSQSGNERSITEIAYACGFNSSSHFSTCFRAHFGVSPRAYGARARSERQ